MSPSSLKITPEGPKGEDNTFVDVGNGVAVLQREAGKLYLCRCTSWGWQCRKNQDGSTSCVQQCQEWECEEVEAVLRRSTV